MSGAQTAPGTTAGTSEVVATASTRLVGGKGTRGVAIILVLVCLAIIAPFTMSFNYQARVDWQSAINVRDEVAARNIQRGAMQLSLLLFEIQERVFNTSQFREFTGGTRMDITQVAPYLMSVFGTPDGAEAIGALASTFGDFGELNTAAFSDLAIEGGTFEFRVAAASGKINVNCLADQGGVTDGLRSPAARTGESMYGMMRPTLYDPLFDEEDEEGQRYSRDEIVAAIADYVDEDNQTFDVIRLRSRGGNEQTYRYDELFDPYEPRNARFDSLEELHLVKGVDDDWMAAFAHELTTYGGCKVNLNFASADQIAMVIQYSAVNRDDVEGENLLLKVIPLANYVVESRTFALFKDTNEFKEMIENPSGSLGGLAGLLDEQEEDDRQMVRMPDPIEIRVKGEDNPEEERATPGLEDIAVVADESVYEIEVITEVGAVKKRVTAVYDMKYQRQQSKGQGAWLYVREE